jgi:hypothetical protein
MCKEGDAKLVMEMGLSKLKCTFCPTFMSLAMFATANALIEKHWWHSLNDIRLPKFYRDDGGHSP